MHFWIRCHCFQPAHHQPARGPLLLLLLLLLLPCTSSSYSRPVLPFGCHFCGCIRMRFICSVFASFRLNAAHGAAHAPLPFGLCCRSVLYSKTHSLALSLSHTHTHTLSVSISILFPSPPIAIDILLELKRAGRVLPRQPGMVGINFMLPEANRGVERDERAGERASER
uniref:Secreted protein n=1 Tax=Anopheles albimanus TaxID=7167 RepID=A0A8W7JW47_ANOAL